MPPGFGAVAAALHRAPAPAAVLAGVKKQPAAALVIGALFDSGQVL